MMKLILKEDVPHLGVVGDLVTVKDGYGRNYLLPTGRAILASSRSGRELEHQMRLAAHNRVKATEAAQGAKSEIEALSIAITAKTAPPPLNEDSEPVPEVLPKLFGSVTNRDFAAVLRQSGFKVDHRRVQLTPDRVGTVGKFEAAVRLDGAVIATLPFWVVPEGSEDVEAAKAQVEESQRLAAEKEAQAAAEEAAQAAAWKAADKQAAADAKARAEGTFDTSAEESDADADSAEG